MGCLYNCSICWIIISIWGVIQLTLMGLFYNIRADVLIEDVEPEEYDSDDEFIEKTEANYSAVARNCWIAALAYVLILALSYLCLRVAHKMARKKALQREDDEIFCNPPQQPVKKQKLKKIKTKY